MEKDYFKDRTPEACIFSEVEEGMEVLICEKHQQKIATNLEHLTYGVIIEKLTKKNHSRGIKVKIKTLDDKIAIGRIVYLYK